MNKSAPERFSIARIWVISGGFSLKFSSLSLLFFKYSPKVGNNFTLANKSDLFVYDS